MFAINENGRQQRKPACGQCGGTGYVYLWSVSRSGSREWYCDRSRCKRSWTEAKPIVAAAIGAVGALKSVLPVVTRVRQLALKPAMHGSHAEPARTAPSPFRVLEERFAAAADAAAAGGGESSGAAGLVAGDFMADRVDHTSSWRWSVHAPHG